MSKRDWVSASALGLVVVFVAFWAAFQTGHTLGQERGERQANTDTYARHAQQEINRTCTGMDGAARTKCIIGVVQATNEQARAESDLVAQRNMSRWALWMLVVTAFMAGITALGVFYVWRTLIATQDMARDTREIGEAQTRAYIRCSKVVCKPLGSNGTDDVFSLEIDLQNFGQSPASIVQLLVGIELRRFNGKHVARPMQINAPTDPAMAPQGSTTAILSFSYTAGAAKEVRESRAYLRFTVALVFDDVFGKRTEYITYHHTEGSLLDSGITASHIVGMKPDHKPKAT